MGQRAYASGLGAFELHVNGRKVGDHVMDPGQSVYDRKVLYVSFDLMDHLNDAMHRGSLFTAPGHPVISCNISKGSDGAPDYAFVELRNVEETDNCFLMKEKFKEGLTFKDCKLYIKRPN